MSYQPDAVPGEAPAGLKAWLSNQFRRIASSLLDPTPRTVTLAVLGTAPARPRDGMIVYADGTSWNPGGGAGVYARVSGAWVKL